MNNTVTIARTGAMKIFGAVKNLPVGRGRSIHCTKAQHILPHLPDNFKSGFSTIAKDTRSVTLNLLPVWKGQTKQGVRYAPAILLGKIKEFLTKDLPVNFLPDTLVNKVTNATYPEVMKTISEEMIKSDIKDELIVNIGGDHSISMITVPVMAAKYPNLRVIWIDAHADINNPNTSPSGNFHGMPVYYFSDASPGDGSDICKVKLRNLVYIGVRDIDDGEQKQLDDNNIRNYEKSELDKKGVQAVVEEIISDLDLKNNPVHISFDVDSLDPTLAPSTGTKVPNGLSTNDAVQIIRTIKQTGNLVSCDVVEFNPLIGSENDVELTIRSITPVIKTLLD